MYEKHITSEKITAQSTGKPPVPKLIEVDFTGRSSIDQTPPTEKELDQFTDSFRKAIMDQRKEYSLPVALISILQKGDKIPVLTLKSFSLWQGKQKSKKTTALVIWLAAFLRGSHGISIDPFFECLSEGTIIFFDNEQGESYAARTMKLILKLAGLEHSIRLIYCDLRGHSPVERMKIIKAGIADTPGVKIVVIDGLVDLLTDFMDAAEGHAAITEILKLCSFYNIHIAGVLHQNKNDKNARAHIGTIASQKCEVEISTEVDPDDRSQSFVECINSRGMPFEKFAIRWDKGSLPQVNMDWNASAAVDAKATKNFEKAKELCEAIFKPFRALSHADSITSIMNATRKSESTAKRALKEYIVWGLVEKGTDGNYRRKMSSEGSRVHEGSTEGS